LHFEEGKYKEAGEACEKILGRDEELKREILEKTPPGFFVILPENR
jgi:hypothetical protein